MRLLTLICSQTAALWVGCTHGRPDCFGSLGPFHEECAYKRTGAEGDLARPLGLPKFNPRFQCRHYVRQCHCYCLSKESGGTQSLSLCQLASQVCMWAEIPSITLIPTHIPGHLNVLADQLSRKDQVLKTEWSLNPAVVRRVFRHWGQSPSGSFRSQAKFQASDLLSICQ